MLPSFSKGGMNRRKSLHFLLMAVVFWEKPVIWRLWRNVNSPFSSTTVGMCCCVPIGLLETKNFPWKPPASILRPRPRRRSNAATVSGPKFCGLPDGDDDAVTATAGTSGLVAPDSGSSGLVAPDSGSSGLVAPDSGSSGLVAPDSGSSGLVAPDSGSSGLVAPVVLPATLAPLPALPDTVSCFEWDER